MDRIASIDRTRQDDQMGEIVNLRRVKKQLAKAEQARLAKENRIRHGRTGPEKKNITREQARHTAKLDGERRE